MEEQNKNAAGFLLSFNLMLIGGILLFGVIISANKLLNHFMHDYWEQSRGIMASVGQMEAETFRIQSEGELYLVWISLIFSFVGLIIVIKKLVKTWSV